MKPLNLDNKPCSPISSNCVIWQGPDIPCIKLCTGDTVSDVVFKLATELCTIIDQLNVSNYDLSCFNLASCSPQTFQELLQFLIEQICAAQGITISDGKIVECPDCVVSVAPCFVQGTQTTMQLVDYVQMIGNRLCSIVDEIASINSQITNINATLADLQFQIDNLPVYTLPEIPVDCILGPGNHPLDVILDALMNDNLLGYCALLSATGTPSEINTAVLSQCILDTDQPLAALPAVNTFSAYYAGSWVAAPALGASPTVANAINNAWIAICDIYNYLQASPAISVVDTTTVNLSYTSGVLTAGVQDTGWVDLLGFTYMASNPGRPQCRRIGNEIHFRGYITIPMGNDANGAAGVINAAPAPASYVALAYGNTFNTVDSGNAIDSCLLKTYNGANWASIATPGLALWFNRGNSVIPTGVLGPGQFFDGSYTISTRNIIYRTVRVSDGKDAALYSLVSIAIRPTGELVVGTIVAEESYDAVGSGYLYSGLARNVISNIISGENVPTYTAAAPSQYNASAAGVYSDSNLTGLAATWSFSQDAGRADQLGGFQFRLDGLSAFINPCDTTIPTPTPCP